MGIVIFKAVCIILILFLAYFISGLYKVFEKLPDNKGNDKGYVALGMMAEVILIIQIAIQIITR